MPEMQMLTRSLHDLAWDQEEYSVSSRSLNRRRRVCSNLVSSILLVCKGYKGCQSLRKLANRNVKKPSFDFLFLARSTIFKLFILQN